MQITTMNSAACATIGEAAREALEKVAADHGLTLTPGGGSFDPETGTFTPKFTFALDGAEQRAFERVAGLFGLEPSDYGTIFRSGGREMRLTGLNTRRPKFPVSAVEVRSGKAYKLTEDALDRIRAARTAA